MIVRRRAGLGCLLDLAILFGMLLWLAIVAAGFAVLAPFLPPGSRGWLAPAALLTWVGTSVPTAFMVAAAITVRRNRQLDWIFAQVGPGRAQSLVARGWAGVVDGRPVNVWFSRGPSIEVYVEADTRLEAGFSRSNLIASAFSGLTGQALVPVDGDLVARVPGEGWLHRFLDEDARGALAALIPGDAALGTSVLILPDAVKYTVRMLDLGALTPEDTSRWLRDLECIARAAERAGPGPQPVAPGGFATRMRTSRPGIGMGLLFGVGCVVLFLAPLLGFIAFAIARR